MSIAKRIPTLDGWRAIAVSLVIGAHSVTMLRNGGLASAAISLLSHAGYGVDIFFALSGFLISTLLLDEKDQSGSISISGFYTRRAFRILPPMVLYLALIYSAALLFGVSGHEVLASLFFFRNYSDGSWYTGHFWSLSVEEHFYLVMPLLILLLRPRTLLLTCLSLIGVCIIIRWYELAYLDLGSNPNFRTENRFDALLWGSVVAQSFRHDAVKARIKDWLRPGVVIALASVTIGLLTFFDDQAFRRTLTAAIIPVFLAYTVLNPTGISGRVLESAPLRFVGRLSYSLYIWQTLFLVPTSRPLGIVQSFPVALIAPFIMALISYRYVEKPFIRLGRSLGYVSTTFASGELVNVAGNKGTV